MFQIGRVGREGILVSSPLLPIAWFPLTTYIHSYIRPCAAEGTDAFRYFSPTHTHIPKHIHTSS